MTHYRGIDSSKSAIVGVGSALMDLLIHEDDPFVGNAGGVKGGMVYVDPVVIDSAVARASGDVRVVPGGSACNTMVGIGQLGGTARFVGKCGAGPMGRLFRDDLLRQHVEPMLFTSTTPTGRVLSIITPDAQRSMLTDLGASAELQPSEAGGPCYDNAAIVHIEGYLLFNQDLIVAVMEAARKAGARISLDLASYTVVEAAGELLHGLVHRYVDILIANEDEALAYTGIDEEQEALARMAAQADVAVLKVGARGSVIGCGNYRCAIAPHGDGSAVDTTGAGDLWASGFFFGLLNGFSLMDSGNLASRCGHAVCQQVGANIPEENWTSIRYRVEEEWRKNG
jgi:sugar/nucleoside kinase (ribokinase family)